MLCDVTSSELAQAKILLNGVEPHGDYIAACCPFHLDESPSLLVNERRFKCLSTTCQKKGNIGFLLRALRGETETKIFRTKRRRRRNPAKPDIPFAEDLEGLEKLAMDAHVEMHRWGYDHYIGQRGLKDRINPQRLGWYEGWITIPVCNPKHDVVGMALRASPAVAEATGERFTTPAGTKPLLYVPDWTLWNAAEAVFVVFGWFDTLTLVDLGLPAATVQPGDLAPHGRVLEDVRKPIYLVPDSKATEHAHSITADLGWRGHVIELPWSTGLSDCNDYLMNGLGDLLRILLLEGMNGAA